MNRRYFFPAIAAALGAARAGTLANTRINVAIIGVRGRGRALATGFAKCDDASVECLVDVDDRVIPAAADAVEKAGIAKLSLCAPFKKTIVGTDIYTDQLW